MKKTRVLVVDDELSIIKFLRATLEARGYEVLTAINGVEALQKLGMELPDLVILDIMMPEMDGFEVCRRLREWSQIPIIMLSARSDEKDKVKCLSIGADDYLTKPFGIEELVARVNAVLRRVKIASTASTQPAFESGDLKVNFVERQVTMNNRNVKLTPTEYNLLVELVLNANKVLTHTMLLGKVWGPEYGQEKEYLRVFVRRLRKLIEADPDNPGYIITIPTVGYKFQTAA